MKERRDFGIGWSLDVAAGRYEHSRTPGRGWYVSPSQPIGWSGIYIPCVSELPAETQRRRTKATCTRPRALPGVPLGAPQRRVSANHVPSGSVTACWCSNLAAKIGAMTSGPSQPYTNRRAPGRRHVPVRRTASLGLAPRIS